MAHARWTTTAATLCLFVALTVTLVAVPRARDRGGALEQSSAGAVGEKMEQGAELVLVYIGSPHCAFSAAPEIPGIVRASQRALGSRSRSWGLKFASVGVSPSTLPEAGLRHLQGIAEFDEISAGRGWDGLASRYLTASPHGGAAITPQLVVLLRSSTAGRRLQAPDEALLLRIAGRDAMERWLNAGAQVPRLDRANALTEGARNAP